MAEHAKAHDDLKDLTAKVESYELANLEDRGRRNNLRIRIISEKVGLHRVLKPQSLPAHMPRDTLMQMHYYYIKNILRANRNMKDLQSPYSNILIFGNILAFTLRKRLVLKDLMEQLRRNNLPYRNPKSNSRRLSTEWKKSSK
ncbi:Hypothetical predicted protein [Pelobates cultripes]|uniref:Uncharacterized protein n=1 Tax=Pelobates cultripes TaxID=61616 RepID=A0AAD1RC42_PELCU|nr:Hypothetical predicted protein [Pelobates cultripes]